MLRKRKTSAPAEVQPAPAAPLTRLELPRRVVAIPRGPQGGAVLQPVVVRAHGAPLDGNAAADRAPRQLVVGAGIRLDGEIGGCDRLVVHGEARVALDGVEALEVGESGRLEGRATVAAAEIAGRFEGELTVTGRLLVRGTGIVEGTIRFGELEIERGGRLLGNVATSEPPAAALTAVAATATQGG